MLLRVQWRTPSCYGNQSSCHDEVDFSLCFEDTAILYSILLFLWIAAGVLILGSYSGYKTEIKFNFLHCLKLVKNY